MRGFWRVIYGAYDVLGTLLQCHTQSLLEGEDLLQVSTQGGAVGAAQSERTQNKRCIIWFFPPQQYNHVILVFSLQNCCVSPLTDPLQLVVIALTCHWLGGFAGNSSAPSVTLWQTPAHAPRCPAPPANSSTGITVTQVYGNALKGPVMNILKLLSLNDIKKMQI